MKIKWKNLLCYLFAMVFIVVAIVAVTTAVEERVFSGYTTGAPDYDPVFVTVVTYPYQGGGIFCAFLGVVLTMIALFVEFEEKEGTEEEKKECEDDTTLREWIEKKRGEKKVEEHTFRS